MVPKITCFVVILCALQFALAANVQKRGILDTLQSTVASVQQKAADIFGQAKTQFEEIEKQVSSIINSTVANVQTRAAEVIQQIQSAVASAEQIGRNIGPCVSGQTETAKRVVNETETNLQTCTASARSQLNATYADIQNLFSQSLQLSTEITKCFSQGLGALSCLATASGTVVPRSMLLLSSITSDAATFGAQLTPVPALLAQCAADGLSSAATKFASVLATIQSCATSQPTAA